MVETCSVTFAPVHHQSLRLLFDKVNLPSDKRPAFIHALETQLTQYQQAQRARSPTRSRAKQQQRLTRGVKALRTVRQELEALPAAITHRLDAIVSPETLTCDEKDFFPSPLFALNNQLLHVELALRWLMGNEVNHLPPRQGGHPRDPLLYLLAENLAILFHVYTGRRPTASRNGAFELLLEVCFRAVNQPREDVHRRAQAACKAIAKQGR